MKRISLIIIIGLLVGCTGNTKKDFVKLNGFTQGTTYSITYSENQNSNFSIPIEDILEQIDSSMSLYRNNSLINRLNQSETGIEVDTLLARVVDLAITYCRQTDGAFDITVGPLALEWGFHAKKGEMPDSTTVKRFKQFIGPNMIQLEELTITKKFPEVTIDVNAIAQGYTVDVIAKFLEEKDVHNYLVEIGGEIRTKGKSPRGKHWLVGIDKPEDNAITGENLQEIIRLSGESLVTSGNYRKFFVRDGVKYSHTIDPTTGYPVTHSLLSATVIDKTSARADALATAFMVMGTEKAKKWISANPEVDAYLVFSDEAGNYNTWMTEGMKKRIVE
jgi:thiamine biosynthesis lipoprotein